MRIEFHGPSICDFSQFEKDGTIEVQDGLTLKQFLKIVKLPMLWARTLPLLVNYEKVPLDTVLKDGDIVSSYTPLGSG
ncbi:MAG: MoaD/ThiS family protein [Clostridia bacterium]|nr:MoaD/ThiS family protein [Clostridia bacterium]